MDAMILDGFELTDEQLDAMSDLIESAEAANRAGKPGMIILQPMVPETRQVIGFFAEHELSNNLIEIVKNG